ncbi:MAG TPA: NAD(+)/NADH kinase [Ktedonobacterales bacterium]|nr:NAD(+)/NADH kinase [Ktedonobacterales bacterium]
MSANGHAPIRTVGIFYKTHNEGAVTMSERLVSVIEASGREVWRLPGRASDTSDGRLAHTDLVVVLGGDGSIISAARVCAPKRIPILGVNFGRVGFLTELEPDDVDEKLPLYLDGDYWVDVRSMLQAELHAHGGAHSDHPDHPAHFYMALNDIVVARGAEPHVIRVKIWVDGFEYNTTVADGVIVSTATGSTAYNLAAGGPILHPQVRSNVLTPIAPHLVADRSLILEPNAVISLELQDGSDNALLSADGQINHALNSGDQVRITNGEHTTSFLRRRSPTHFYRVLTAKLREDL